MDPGLNERGHGRADAEAEERTREVATMGARTRLGETESPTKFEQIAARKQYDSLHAHKKEGDESSFMFQSRMCNRFHACTLCNKINVAYDDCLCSEKRQLKDNAGGSDDQRAPTPEHVKRLCEVCYSPLAEAMELMFCVVQGWECARHFAFETSLPTLRHSCATGFSRLCP